MEVLMDYYFDKLFANMKTNNFTLRHKRQKLVLLLSGIINNFAKAEIVNKIDVCEHIVNAALRYHTTSVTQNNSVCLFEKFHNILYIVAKLCYDWQLNNNELINKILKDIFDCEKTFERIFIGAIFGTKVTYFLSGWKSDFANQKENMNALIYFLDHAIKGRLEFYCLSLLSKRRFIDVPMESYGHLLPIHVAIQNGSSSTLQIMLRYGASVKKSKLIPTAIEILFAQMNKYNKEVKYLQQLLMCLKLLLRTIPTVHINVHNYVIGSCSIQNISIFKLYTNLDVKKLLPIERLGTTPPELKHLCRCRIRQCLFDNWALPHGIKQLHIPKILQDYLDLLAD